MKLQKIEVQGSSLFTPAEIGRMGGLRAGQDIDMAGLEKATRTLSEWGYFLSIRFSYSYVGTNLTVTFQLQDQKVLYSYLFDNFTALGEEELLEAVRRDYPSFADKLPPSGAANQYIKEKIEGLLAQKGSPAVVSFVPTTRPGGAQGQMVFHQSKEVPVCTVRVEGLAGNVDSDLAAASAALQKSPYSRQRTREFFAEALLPVARKHGYWRLQLLEIAAREEPPCSTGASLVLQFSDGGVYSWGSAIWEGNQKQPVAALDELAGMKRGELANLEKIEAGLSRTSRAYWTDGFLDFTMTPRPEQDDQRHEVSYRIQIKEGEQYRMGEFVCANPIQPNECNSLKSKWKIRSGDILNGALFDAFQAESFQDWKKEFSPRGVEILIVLQRDSAMRIANVLVIPQAIRSR